MKKIFVLLCCLPNALISMNDSSSNGKPPPPPYDAPGSPTLGRRAVPPRRDSRSSSATTTIERRTSGGHATSATNSFTPGESPKKQVSFGHLSAVNSSSEPPSPRGSMTLPAPAIPAPNAVLPALIKALEAQTELLRQMAAAQERQAQATELLAQEIRLASVVNLRNTMAAEDWVLCAACLVDEGNTATVRPAVEYLRTRWEQLIELRRRERERERARAAEQGQQR